MEVYNGTADPIVTEADTATLTNKTIAAGSNTVTGITNTNLSGSAAISNANLANSTVTVGSTSIALGATAATVAGLTLTSPTLTTPILGAASGTSLSLSSLTASSAVATDGSKNLVSVANTGTGSNVLATSPTLVTPILGTPTSGTLTNVTGLPISTGVSGLGTGIATFLATPSSANLASATTDETGSGALVFATSPTLVTPILGTPTSGTLTNATGLPIIAGTTGTLSEARGGTGQITLGAGTVTATGGSTARSLASRFAQVANVKDYGALGDGSTNDTAAVQAAATSLTNGGLLFFPQGNYIVASAVTLTAGTHVQGVSAYASAITVNAAAANIFIVSGTTKIEDMKFTCSTTATSGSFIKANGNFITVYNCQFSAYFNALSFGDSIQSVGCSINTCNFYSPSIQSGGGAILATNFSNFTVKGCVISGPAFTATQPDYGIQLVNGDTCLLSDNNITLHGNALYVAPPVSNNIYALQAVNCLFDSAGTKASTGNAACAQLTSTGGIYNTKFSNCWFGLSYASDGCNLGTSGAGVIDGIAFTGCQFVKNGGNGLIAVGTGVKNWTVTGGDSEGNTSSGIRAASATTYFTITGHRSGNVSARGANNYGILVDNAASDFYEISSNNLYGNTTAGLLDQGTGANKIVLLNTGSVAIPTATYTGPTIQKFTSGSGTYTTPTSPRSPLYIRVRLVGGGGGGGATGTSPGSANAGGDTTFGSSLLTGTGGSGANANAGGGGGAATNNAIGLNFTGTSGQPGPANGTSSVNFSGGAGGCSAFGGGGSPAQGGGFAGNGAKTNTGSGGGGASGSVALTSAGGGGAGGFIDAVITSPSATYAYAVGASGAGQTLGTGGSAGGAGAAGIIEVTEYYQ